MGEEITEALESMRNSRSILKEINNTFLVFIPKSDHCKDFGNFRPIALCNTLYKLFTKTLASRLQTILPRLISEEQSGSIQGRSIYDGMIIAQETIHSLKLIKTLGMLIKLDISKAYDKVNWRFLCKCLPAFGFTKAWINLIFECISTPKFLVLINGTSEGFFSPLRGIRQGDPISPFLFILLLEALGKSLKQKRIESSLKGLKIANSSKLETHQQFIDSTLLYGEANEKEAEIINSTLIDYTKASRQEINSAKSEIFFFNTEEATQKRISTILNISIGSLPCKYLGFQLNDSSNQARLWEPLVGKIRKKIHSWKGKWLSLARTTTMLKSVLSSIPIYQLSLQNPPTYIENALNKSLKDFFGKVLITKGNLT